MASYEKLISIEGGTRIRDVGINEVTREGDDHLTIRVNHPGDFSNYRLSIASPPDAKPGDPMLDPVYSSVEFNFKVACPSQFDCRPAAVCEQEPEAQPVIDYMAKDYASFRQALLDRIPQIHPDWVERSPADLGMTLVELLAYVGDHLSYYQDAVANEAYLDTARQRISVRRHARLIDYSMHDGVSARLFAHLQVNDALTLPAGTQLLARIDVPLEGESPPDTIIPARLADTALGATAAVFETQEEAHLDPLLDNIPIHNWKRSGCCLPKGATCVDLRRALDGVLQPGGFLLLEELVGVETGNEADADPTHRQIVRVVEVNRFFDPVARRTLTRVRWDAADALRFPLCISLPGVQDPVSVAHANLVLADHGRSLSDSDVRPEDQGSQDELRVRPYRFKLKEGPLSYRITPQPSQPVYSMSTSDPKSAVPGITQLSVSYGQTEEKDWKVQPDLLSSDPEDRHFVVETDNSGRAQVRFGDDTAGKAPPKGSQIHVTYRVGVGSAGMLPATSVEHLVEFQGLDPSTIKRVRNPLPAWGGIDPEPIEVVRQTAPAALRQGLHRAVTEDDYARVAEMSDDVSKAVATFRWTGFWHTVSLTIDPRGSTVIAPEQEKRILDHVRRYTQTGYDLRIDHPVYVPLDIVVEVCVDPDHFRADVAEELALEMSDRVLPARRLGFFHPDRFTFGQSLYASQIHATVTAVEGVRSARLTRFKRLNGPEAGEIEHGSVTAGRFEILRLDNDPNFPEYGVLRFDMRGGK